MPIKIGTGPDSWGVWAPSAPGQIPWNTFLDESAEASYEWIEAGMYGYLPTDVPMLQDELDKRGLKVTATTVMNGHLDEPADWPKLEKTVLSAGGLGASLGTHYLVLIDDTYTDRDTKELAAPRVLDGDSWKRLVEATHRVADLARSEFGLPIAFHPHAETHVETEEQIEQLLEETDPDRVSLCLDTGHHAYSGGEPVSFLRKHHDRVSYLHLKSVDASALEKVRAKNLTLEQATETGVFCEPQDGVVDFVALAEVLQEIGYDGWATVEQDMRMPPLDVPLPIARRTRAYLKEVGIG